MGRRRTGPWRGRVLPAWAACRRRTRRTADDIARPGVVHTPAYRRRSLISRLRSLIPRRRPIRSAGEGLVIEHRSRWQWAKRLYSASTDGHGRVPVTHGQREVHVRSGPVHGNHRNGSGVDGMARQYRARDRVISMGTAADVWPSVESAPPPRPTAAKPRRPAPAKVVVEVPCPALERHIAPWVTGDPEVAVTRRPHPVPVSVGVKPLVRCFIGRPDIPLSWHVVPVAIGVQIVPTRILARAHI